MEEEIVYCPRCTTKMNFSPGESTITKARYNCPQQNCKKEYTKNTATGELVEVSVVVGAVLALGGLAWTVAHYWFTGKPPAGS